DFVQASRAGLERPAVPRTRGAATLKRRTMIRFFAAVSFLAGAMAQVPPAAPVAPTAPVAPAAPLPPDFLLDNGFDWAIRNWPADESLYLLAQAAPRPSVSAERLGIGQGIGTGIGQTSNERLYQTGQTQLDNRQWDLAVQTFSQVVSRGLPRADGALYW